MTDRIHTVATNDPFAVLDLAHLSRQTCGDLPLQRELLDLFRTHSPELVEKIRALAGVSQKSALCDLAHQLKGSALALGANAVAAAAESVELAFDAKSHSDDGETALKALSTAVAKTLLAIDSYRRNGSITPQA